MASPGTPASYRHHLPRRLRETAYGFLILLSIAVGVGENYERSADGVSELWAFWMTSTGE